MPIISSINLKTNIIQGGAIILKNDLLFQYRINSQKVKIYRSEPKPVENDSFHKGVVMAIADYLFYPYEVIAPRIETLNISFVYDDIDAAEDVIEETTQEAILTFLEANTHLAEEMIPHYVIRPDLSETKLNTWIENAKKYDISTTGVTSMGRDGENIWLEITDKGEKFYEKYIEKHLSKYLIVSLPCFNADWNDISYLYDLPCDILQLSPLGYNTPSGFSFEKRKYGTWPVLLETVTETDSDLGYNKWFHQAGVAVNFFKKQKKLIFLGTSQGGGASLVLSSIFNDITEACLSEMPFLIGLSDKNYSKVRDYAASTTGKMVYDFYAKERLFVIDPLAHASRIRCRTLLVAGELDEQCPKEDICELNDKLNCEKKYIELKGTDHGYTEYFKKIAKDYISEIVEYSK